MVCFVVTQHSESALSLCLRYSKTSCEATPKKSTEHTEYTECLGYRLKVKGYRLEIIFKIIVG